MCTLITLHRCVAGAPLVVAANRDEFHERPSEGPALRAAPHGMIAAPRDKRAGGTWLGMSSTGVFAAVTNRRSDEPDPTRRSRGLLVLEALAAPSAQAAAERFERLAERAYNPFNLFVADAASAHVVTYAERASRIDLEPGAHVIGNAHPAEATPKIARLRAEVERVAAGPASGVLDALAGVCRSHEGADALAATCVHAGAYGTRSSTLLRLGDAPGDDVLLYAAGPPCRCDYRDFTPLLRELGLDSPGSEGDSTRNTR
jgi:uncharacterized protein with NRDE domain